MKTTICAKALHLRPISRRWALTWIRTGNDRSLILTEQQGNAKTLAREKVEWGVNLESESNGNIVGKSFRWTTKGRCKRCWDGLFGRTGDSGAITGIKCRSCGALVEGPLAREEDQRMVEELSSNLLNLRFGKLPAYNDGPFAYKILEITYRINMRSNWTESV